MRRLLLTLCILVSIAAPVAAQDTFMRASVDAASVQTGGDGIHWLTVTDGWGVADGYRSLDAPRAVLMIDHCGWCFGLFPVVAYSRADVCPVVGGWGWLCQAARSQSDDGDRWGRAPSDNGSGFVANLGLRSAFPIPLEYTGVGPGWHTVTLALWRPIAPTTLWELPLTTSQESPSSWFCYTGC